MSLRSLLSILSVAPAILVCKAQTTVDNSECDCYISNGTQPIYYSGHLFFDFRSLLEHSGAPPIFTSVEEQANGVVTSSYFEDGGDFSKVWGLQSYQQGEPDFPMQYSKSNVYIERNEDSSANSDTYLTMRTVRLPDFQGAAEFESIEKYNFASMRMYARTIGSPGACTAMFTYLQTGTELSTVQEADIEVLTSDPDNLIHYTNQPAYTEDGEVLDGAAVTFTLPKPWTEWGYHRMDWTPRETVWTFDGRPTAVNAFQVPRDPSNIVFNTWSDGKTWTGKMPLDGKAYQHIQWIEILHGEADGASCSRVCSIDKTPVTGKPVRV